VPSCLNTPLSRVPGSASFSWSEWLWRALNQHAAQPAWPPTRAKAPRPSAPTPTVVRWTSDHELIGWCAWRLGYWEPDGGLRLVSLSTKWVWDGPVFTSDIIPEAIEAHHSGVCALKRRPLTHSEWAWSPDCCVTGWVALSGRVVEHGLGYRAERVVIRRLRLGIGTHLRVVDPDYLRWIQSTLEQRHQAPVKLGAVERRFAIRRRSKSSLVGGGMRMEFVRPDGTWGKK
jgi:hypothetical protein